jgi:hypothetical protein
MTSFSGPVQNTPQNFSATWRLRTAADTETKDGEPAVLAVSWRPTAPLITEARIISREIAARAGQ